MKISELKQAKTPNFAVFGDIFEPVIPGIVLSGICSGLAALMAQFCPGYTDSVLLTALYQLLTMVNTAFFGFMPAWVGYSASKVFGGTAILGGMLGMITGLDGIDTLSRAAGLYNAADPAASILCAGRGGILAAILGGFLLAKAEGIFRRKCPKSLETILPAFGALLLVLVPYIFVIMPVTGMVSTGLCAAVGFLCESELLVVRIVAGYLCAALFLVAVMLGMQYAFVALYSIQLDTYGYVTLFPTLAMAGAGQVGAGLALLVKARRAGNGKFAGVIAATIVPGMMGVGSPLLYGVTLPLGTPFLTACLGGGFGGAFIMATGVASSGWGASGLLGIPMMGAGAVGTKGMLLYTIGLAISCAMGFVLTWLFVPQSRVKAHQSVARAE